MREKLSSLGLITAPERRHLSRWPVEWLDFQPIGPGALIYMVLGFVSVGRAMDPAWKRTAGQVAPTGPLLGGCSHPEVHACPWVLPQLGSLVQNDGPKENGLQGAGLGCPRGGQAPSLTWRTCSGHSA